MRTLPDFALAPPECPSHTEVTKDITLGCGSEIKPTEVISFTKIVKAKEKEKEEETGGDGRVSSIDCKVDFSFEKERIKAIEHTELFASMNTVPINQESVLMSSKMAELVYNNILHKGQTRGPAGDNQSQENVAKILKTLSVVLALFATINAIAAFFAILFLSISSMPIGQFIVWISAEIFVTVCFVCLSLNGSGAAQFNPQTLTAYLKRLLIFSVLVLGLFVTLCAYRPLQEEFSCALNWGIPENTSEENYAAMYCLILVCLFFTTLYKLLVTVGYVVLALMLRRKLVSMPSVKVASPDESQRQALGFPASIRLPNASARGGVYKIQ